MASIGSATQRKHFCSAVLTLLAFVLLDASWLPESGLRPFAIIWLQGRKKREAVLAHLFPFIRNTVFLSPDVHLRLIGRSWVTWPLFIAKKSGKWWGGVGRRGSGL